MAFWAHVATAAELVMAHSMEMETGSPILYVRVRERFIVLGQGKIWGVGGAWVIQDVEIGWEYGAFHPEVIQESVYLGNSGSQTELGASSKESVVEVDVTSLEEGEESVYFLMVRSMFNEGNEGVPHGHVMGVGFMDEANGRLRVDSMV